MNTRIIYFLFACLHKNVLLCAEMGTNMNKQHLFDAFNGKSVIFSNEQYNTLIVSILPPPQRFFSEFLLSD